VEEQETLDLGPQFDSDRGRFHTTTPKPGTAWWARQKEQERQQLSLFPVQAVTAPNGWETYQRARERYSPTTR